MGPIPEAIVVRGEVVSAVLVVVVLLAVARPLAAVLGIPRPAVSDLYFNGAIAFVAAGRAAYLILEDRGSAFDPLVAIQIQGGIEPLAGTIAVGALVAWEVSRRREVAWPIVAAGALGLVVAAIVYDGGCVVRDACYGAPAPAPLGFRMGGLADTRLATPLVEAALLLGVLWAVFRAWRRLSWPMRAAIPFAAVALLRAALTPLSVLEWDAVGFRTYVTVAAGMGVVGGALVATWMARAGRSVRIPVRTSS